MTTDGPRRVPAAGPMPQLDGLRGLAVLGVLFHHFADFAGRDWPGWCGVELFFVLSGFLITRILLAERERGGPRGSGLAVFYARRALRIFPVYFLTLGAIWALDVPRARELGWWLGTYTYNWYVGTHGWAGTFGHFWSLCVEEQFYMAWPWVVLFCPARWLAPVMAAVAATGPLWRLGCALAGTSRLPLIVMPFASFDCLAVGALLAYYTRPEQDGTPAARRFLLLCRVGGTALMAFWAAAMTLRDPLLWNAVPVEAVFGNSAMALFFAAVVHRAAVGTGGDLGTLLGMGWLRYLGRISYGVYVYHLFMPSVTAATVPHVPWLALSPVWVNLTLSVGLGSASWHLLESRINRLKGLFPYTEPARLTVVDPVPARRAA